MIAAVQAAIPPREESLRRQRRKGSYHLAVSRNKLPNWEDLKEDEGDNFLFRYLTSTSLYWQRCSSAAAILRKAKANLFLEIVGSNGETNTEGFDIVFEQLRRCYDPSKFDARRPSNINPSGQPSRRAPPARTGRVAPNCRLAPRRGVPSRGSGLSPQMEEPPQRLDGMWITLSKPNFAGFVGYNEDDNYMYTLGRMSFGTSSHAAEMSLDIMVLPITNSIEKPLLFPPLSQICSALPDSCAVSKVHSIQFMRFD